MMRARRAMLIVAIVAAACAALPAMAVPVLGRPLGSPCAAGPPAGEEPAGAWVVVPDVQEGSHHSVTELIGRVCFGGPMHPPIPGDWWVSIWARPGTATTAASGWTGRRDYRFHDEAHPFNREIRDGVREVRFTIDVLGDDVPEDDERFTVEALGFMGYLEIPITPARVTIRDDDGSISPPPVSPGPSAAPTPPLPPSPGPTPATTTVPSPTSDPVVLSVEDVSMPERDDGWTMVPMHLVLSRPLTSDLVVRYQLAPGEPPASFARDYRAAHDGQAEATNLVSIPAGRVSARVLVEVIGDHVAEHDERLLVRIVSAAGVATARPVGTLTILDDDEICDGIADDDGDGIPDTEDPDCDRVRDGLDNDADGLIDSDDPDGDGGLPPPEPVEDAILSIRCAQEPYGLFQYARRVREPEQGTVPIRCVMRVTPVHLPSVAGVGHPVAARIRTRDGSATIGSDVTLLDERLSLAPYQRTATSSVFHVLADAIEEPDETFTVELSEPESAVLGAPRGSAGAERQAITIARLGDPCDGLPPVEPDDRPGGAAKCMIIADPAGEAVILASTGAGPGIHASLDAMGASQPAADGAPGARLMGGDGGVGAPVVLASALYLASDGLGPDATPGRPVVISRSDDRLVARAAVGELTFRVVQEVSADEAGGGVLGQTWIVRNTSDQPIALTLGRYLDGFDDSPDTVARVQGDGSRLLLEAAADGSTGRSPEIAVSTQVVVGSGRVDGTPDRWTVIDGLRPGRLEGVGPLAGQGVGRVAADGDADGRSDDPIDAQLLQEWDVVLAPGGRVTVTSRVEVGWGATRGGAAERSPGSP